MNLSVVTSLVTFITNGLVGATKPILLSGMIPTLSFIYYLMCIVATEESGKSDRKSNFAALGQSRKERQLKKEREKNVSTASGNNLTGSWHESLNSWEELMSKLTAR